MCVSVCVRACKNECIKIKNLVVKKVRGPISTN